MTMRYLFQLLAVVLVKNGTHPGKQHPLQFWAGRGCLSMETSCTAMETNNGTIYIVHGITGSNCDFSWINSSNHVMANGGGKIEKIISSNGTHLHTLGCYETVVYCWDCMSEMSTTATCHVNCTRSTEHPPEPENPPVWLIVVISASVLLVISVILFFVCRTVRRRLKQQRYTGGKPSHLNQVEIAL